MPNTTAFSHIWLAYVNYPVTTAAYLTRAFRETGHRITTIGPRLPMELITRWRLEKMPLPLDPLDIDTSFTPNMAALLADTPVRDHPDLYLWIESVSNHTPRNLGALRCPKACYLIDTHYHLEQSCAIAQQFDYVFIAQLVDLEAMRRIHPRVYWLPLACDPAIHAPARIEKLWDVGFVGSMNPRRESLLSYLAQYVSVHQESAFWHDMARVFSSSRIVLNDASYDDLNMRFFEALGCGALLISNRTTGSAQDILFRDGVEYACHDEHNLLETVQHYLADEALQEAVAAQGRRRVLAAHTYRHRVDDFLQVLLQGKPDTYSAEELRQRSLDSVNEICRISGSLSETVTTRRQSRITIRSIITTRETMSWPTWQMIHEWEDYTAEALGASLKQLSPSCMIADPSYLLGSYDLVFLPVANMLEQYGVNHQVIPVVMDLWERDLEVFLQRAPSFRLIFVTSLQIYRMVRERGLTNVAYLPFSLADRYVEHLVVAKKFDIIQFGRRNPLLDSYMTRLLTSYPNLSYITTGVEGDDVYFYSNHEGRLCRSDSRSTFMAMLSRCRISLVSPPGMDWPEPQNAVTPVSPRFLESIAAGCHLTGLIPSHDEFDLLGIRQFCHAISSYESFEQTILRLLDATTPSAESRRNFLRRNSTAARAKQICVLLEQTRETDGLSLFTEDTMNMNQMPQRPRLEQLLTELRTNWPTLTHSSRMDVCRNFSSIIGFYDEFWQLDLYDLFDGLILLQESASDILLMGALELMHRGNTTAARRMAQRCKELDRTNVTAVALHASLLCREGYLDAAQANCLTMLQKWPDSEEAQANLVMCDIARQLLPMEHYHLLHSAHTLLQPRTYLEIGVSNGKSLALSGKNTIAVGIDPLYGALEQQLFISPARLPRLFKMTSNDFFAQKEIQKLFPGGRFDIAFIDGLHLFEQTLMDFVHLEQCATPESIIFMHDCLPVNEAVAARERTGMVWTGDVWKIIPCLKAVRPDLEIITFPVSPSGLAIVRRLDPKSRVLSTQFDSITAHFFDLQLPENREERFRLLNVTNVDPTMFMNELYRQQGSYTDKGETLT